MEKDKQIAFLTLLALLFIHKFWYFEFVNMLIANKIFCVSEFLHLFTFAINLWPWNFVTADVTAVFVNNQHGIQRQGQDCDKNA